MIDFTVLNDDGSVISKETYELLKAKKMQLIGFQGIPPPAMDIQLVEIPFVRYRIRPFDPPQ